MAHRSFRRRDARPPAALFALPVALVLGLAAAPEPADAVLGVEAREPACRVGRVIDGDTVDLACGRATAERARLVGFDTPESHRPRCAEERRRAEAATAHLRRLVAAAGHVAAEDHGRDRYGRRLVSLSLDGRPVAEQMIGSGHARHYDGGRRRGWCGPEAPRPA